ncbi:MAG TPA: thiamine phosphate synthase [Methylococcaceae bacterium]|jgi:thiamine-phosphate pyrophosphorylase|nr:thiamine phosphate synthase [Methylococcaceae bacterium]
MAQEIIHKQSSYPFPSQGLYVITRDPQEDRTPLLKEVKAAIRGGAVVVQYRAKDGRGSEDEARQLLAVCRASCVPLIINDDVALALAIGADGVHLGREDEKLAPVRDALGPKGIIGVSCYDDLPRAMAAQRDGATYVAFGRFFPSMTKPNAPCASLETLRQARLQLHIPIVAIGGITRENAETLISAGAGVLAVIEGVFGEQSPEAAARCFRALWG